MSGPDSTDREPTPYDVRTFRDWLEAVKDAGLELPRPIDVSAVLAALGGFGVVGEYVAALEGIVRNVRAVLVRDFTESGIVFQANKGPCTIDDGGPHCDDNSCDRCREWIAAEKAVDDLWVVAQGWPPEQDNVPRAETPEEKT